MFFSKDDVALFGDDFINNGIQQGLIYSVGNDSFINAEDVQEALRKVKIVEVYDGLASAYRKREDALIEKEKGNLVIVEGTFVTSTYFQHALQTGDIIVCDECGEYIFAENCIKTESGLNVCQRCADRHFARCEDCGKWYPKRLVKTVSGHKYCGECISRHAFQCPHCGRYYLANEVLHHTVYVGTYSTEEWCQSCFDNDADTCSNCHRAFPRRDLDENHLCRNCRSYENTGNYINSYGYHPTPFFFGSNQEGDNGLFYGVELETDIGNAFNFARSLRTVREVYCKHDGSLSENGCEVVTHPATLKYHMESDLWDRVNAIATENGMRSHETTTCGLHIHISRKPFRDANISHYEEKIALAFEKFWNEWIVFSRRKGTSINRWAARYNASTIEELSNTMHDGSRYHSVNIRNAGTVEIRIFRGSLKVDTIKSTIWAIANIAERVLNGWSPESANSFRELFEMDKAPEFFVNYLNTRGL